MVSGGWWRLAVGGPLRWSLRAVLGKKKYGPLRTALLVLKEGASPVVVASYGERWLWQATVSLRERGPLEAGLHLVPDRV